MSDKKVIIIAGPNGAGKTTLYRLRVDDWVWYNNSGTTPVLLEKKNDDKRTP